MKIDRGIKGMRMESVILFEFVNKVFVRMTMVLIML